VTADSQKLTMQKFTAQAKNIRIPKVTLKDFLIGIFDDWRIIIVGAANVVSFSPFFFSAFIIIGFGLDFVLWS
jgi:hypothetical protein